MSYGELKQYGCREVRINPLMRQSEYMLLRGRLLLHIHIFLKTMYKKY